MLKRAEVSDEVAVAHLQAVLEILEGPLRTRVASKCHDGKAALFVDRLIDFGEIDHAGRLVIGPLWEGALAKPTQRA